MPVLGGSLDGVHCDFSEVGIRGFRDGPFDVVMETASTGKVSQNQLITQTRHIVLTKGAAKLAQFMRRALLRHGVASAYRVASLIDAQTILAKAHCPAQALGVARAHDRLAAHWVDQVERDLITGHLLQVHAANNRHFIAGLLADGGLGLGLLRELAGKAVQRCVALHVRSKKASRLQCDCLRRAIRKCGSTHVKTPSKGPATPSRRCQ